MLHHDRRRIYSFLTRLFRFPLSRNKTRCEAILRNQPQSRVAKELHLASMEAQEDREVKRMKQTAVASVGVAAVVGVAAGIAGLLMKK